MELSYTELYDGFLYLDELRDSGSVNMYAAPRYLAKHMGIELETAKTIWVHWMNTFDGVSSVDDRVDISLEKITNDT